MKYIIAIKYMLFSEKHFKNYFAHYEGHSLENGFMV